jgi:hypothetical protein
MHPLSHRKRLRLAEKWTSVSPWAEVAAAGARWDDMRGEVDAAGARLGELRTKVDAEAVAADERMDAMGRGLHLSTSPLNSIASCGIWGAFRCCLGGVHGVPGNTWGCLGCGNGSC